jgi:hypothetical protein
MMIKKSQLQSLIRRIISEAVQVLQESQRGEWWIYPGGDAQFADGDIGDSGHEGYVIQYLSREIYEHFCGDAREDIGYLGEWENDIFKELMNDERLTESDLEMWKDRKSGGPLKVILAKLLEDGAYKDPKQAEDAIYIAYGSSRLDPRDYAMKYLGWKRMVTTGGWGTEFQTWFLRQSDLNDMKRGIFDAWGDEDEEDVNHRVSVEVRANNKSFSEIPLNVFENASVSDILTYNRVSAWMR